MDKQRRLCGTVSSPFVGTDGCVQRDVTSEWPPLSEQPREVGVPPPNAGDERPLRKHLAWSYPLLVVSPMHRFRFAPLMGSELPGRFPVAKGVGLLKKGDRVMA